MDFRYLAPRRRSRGLSVVELTTTLAVTLVLLAIGIPGFRSISGNNAISAGLNDMVSHLHYARSEAIKRGIQVVLCPSDGGRDCLDSFHWQDGFMVFADNNGNRRLDERESVLRFHRQDGRRVRILTSAGRKRLVYKPSGMSPGSTATITVCDRTGRVAPQAIILSNPGRPRRSKTRPDGSPLNCE